MDQHVAARGNAGRLLEILLGISTVRPSAAVSSVILSIMRATRIGASPTDGSSTSRIREPASGRRHSFRRRNVSKQKSCKSK